MPARKSNASVADDDSGLSVEDLNLPKTMVNRLAKGALPANFNVQAVAQSAISKSATVFVNYLTAHASDIAARQNKKTIQPKDVLDALKELEFDMFVKRTNEELIKYTEIQCTKRNSYRRRVKDEKRAAGESGDAEPGAGGAGPEDSMMSMRTADEDGVVGSSSAAAGSNRGAGATTNGHAAGVSEPAAKRARMDADADVEDDEQDGDGDEGEGEGEEEGEDEDGPDEEEEEEDEEEEGNEGDREDLLEEREDREDEDEAMDGEESD